MVAAPNVRVSCRKHDWTNALFEGKVPNRTYQIEMREQENVGVNGLLGENPVADYAECGLAGLIQARAAGAPVLAFPVFIRTTFRHSYILIRADRGIDTPKDLEGKRVGTSYNTTATIWIRGLLQDGYGVQLDKISWLDIGPPGYKAPPGVRVERAEKGTNLHDLLRKGEIDALISFDAEMIHHQGSTTVRRLFPDAGKEERDWWRKTHIMPMMNVIACTEATLKNHPDQAREVFDAFVEAKQIGLKELLNNRDSGLFWYWEALEQQLDVLGPDPVPYSVSKNRVPIETLLRYCAEQGIVDHQLGVEDVFYAGFDS
ncbi:MAG TPA: ABC transporter substrate-binding protein [Chloroflexota bacterium]|nr:ABC transporter substrate-binding protein [Chloroflexota bacterium]